MKKNKLFTSLLSIAIALGTLVGCAPDYSSRSVNKIMIATKPDKLTYNVGELFDPTGLVLVARYDNGATTSITSGYTWDITTPLEEDDDEIIITYKHRSTLLDININIKNPKTIEVKTLPTKTTYVVGEKFDPTGMVLTGTYEDGTTEDYTMGYRYSKAKIKSSDYQWKITYNRASCYVPITVEQLKVTSISIKTPPTKTTYKEGEYFSTEGVSIEGVYQDGTTSPIVDYSYSPNVPLKVTDTKVVFSYNDLTCEYPITVEAVPLLVRVKTNPTKLNYVVGENFDPTGMVIEKQENGNIVTLDESQYTLSGGTNLGLGSVVKVVLNSDNTVYTRVPVTVSQEVNLLKDHVTKSAGSKCDYASNITLAATATNGEYLANFKDGDLLTLKFNSTSAGKAALFIKSASTYVTKYSSVSKSTWFYPVSTGTVQANKLFEIYVNGVKTIIPDTVVYEGTTTEDPNGDVLLLAQWKNVEMNNIDLLLGENTLEIKFIKHSYKNADTELDDGSKKEGVLSSPVMDTVSIRFDSASAIEHSHAYNQKVESEQYLAQKGDCSHKHKYFFSCECGDKGSETFEGAEYGEHNYEFITENGNEYRHCDICGEHTLISSGEKYSYTASENNGVLTLNATSTNHSYTKEMATSSTGIFKTDPNYNSGDENYHDLGEANIIGNNNIASITDSFAKTELIKKGDRENAMCQSEGTVNVTKALVKAGGHDYITYLYNGAGVEVKFNSDTTGKKVVVLKAASGWCTTSAFCTGDMQFNKIMDFKVNNQVQTLGDDLILKGKDGGKDYGVAHANWMYLVFEINVVAGENTIQFISKLPYKDNGEALYYDVSRTENNTIASSRFDAIAIF